ncbi:uncharacterized protein LOC108111688 [Drosophila eugracilis]|uniref:uncharacterized protein LOC108111688 n=1 Tax=Drosophila eugracilis TaxID=29029 RepID=UPI001BD9D7ED|nr:uncharacterized protein LOC108111688 [Drosophila eugracilis]
MWITSLLSLFVVFNCALALNIPHPNCDKYFRYQSLDNGNFIGIFTANTENVRELYWEAKFSSIGSTPDQIGDINPYPSTEGYLDSVRNGKDVQVYVTFNKIKNELPLLIHFSLNGETLCSNHRYAAPSTTVRVARRISVLLEERVMPPDSAYNHRYPESDPNYYYV